MNGTHLIIKSRTVAAQLQQVDPTAAHRLLRLVRRWEALRSSQHKSRLALGIAPQENDPWPVGGMDRTSV